MGLFRRRACCPGHATGTAAARALAIVVALASITVPIAVPAASATPGPLAACATHGSPVHVRHPSGTVLRHPDGGNAAPCRTPAPRTVHATPWTLLAALCLPVCAGLLPAVLRRQRKRRRRATAMALIRREIAQQASRLRIRRMQLLVPDEYGTVREDRWSREKRRFCDTRLRAALRRRRLDRLWPELEAAALRRIERTARAGASAAAGFDPAMHPLEYERHCGRLLEQAGWAVRFTPASGDQGADILATRGGCLLVVQCKLYRNAVGNDAVQQVAAARAHQRAQVAIVVSNARFTASARALARSNRVALLHHDELGDYRPDRAPSDTIASATW